MNLKWLVFLELKVDVEKDPLRFRGKLTTNVLDSFNVPCFMHMTCVSGLYCNELYLMDEKMVNDFFISKWRCTIYVVKAYLFHDLHFVYIVEAFITIN